MKLFGDREDVIAEVTRCVNEYDSEQLLKMGAPKDEYKAEIEQICRALYPTISIQEIWILVCNTLFQFFGDQTKPVLYWNKHEQLAGMIWEAIQRVNSGKE